MASMLEYTHPSPIHSREYLDGYRGESEGSKILVGIYTFKY